MKCSDRAMFGVNRKDEYLTGKYFGPSEAVASVLGFPIHEREPAVVRLQVHLPEENQIIRVNAAVQVNNNMRKTTLSSWIFALAIRLQKHCIMLMFQGFTLGVIRDGKGGRNDIIMISRITINLPEGENIPLQRSQFPVQSCFTMTIHKAQEQTRENVLVYLERPVFQHGQLHVVCSRGERKENVNGSDE
eukprot:XP_014778550.1 PREDICTED: uncharacterized protein LOC106875089 [Octopus bimaculoides]